MYVCTLLHSAGNHVCVISLDAEKQYLPGHLTQPPEIPTCLPISL